MEELRLYLESNELDLSGLDFDALIKLRNLVQEELDKIESDKVKMWAIQDCMTIIKYFRYEDKELALESFRNIISKCVDKGDEYINYSFGITMVPRYEVDYCLYHLDV